MKSSDGEMKDLSASLWSIMFLRNRPTRVAYRRYADCLAPHSCTWISLKNATNISLCVRAIERGQVGDR